MAAKKYLDLVGLKVNNDLIKGLIADGDAKSFKSAKFDANTRILSLYKAETTDGTADFTAEIPETDVSGLLEKIANGTVGNIVTVGADGTVVDSGVAVADIASKTEVEAVDEKVDAAQADVDALGEKIGTVEEGKTVVQMIEDAKTEATYDDTEVRGLIQDNADAIEAHKTEIDGKVTTLIGDDANKSVRTIANEELAKQLIADGAKESLDTLEEIAVWIQSHPDDASAMAKAIDDLEALVGTLPEGVTATTIVGYIQEVVNAEKSRAEGVESGLDTRLKAVEEAVGEGGSVETQINNAIAELDADVVSATVEEGKGIQVQIIETDGKVATVAVTGNYDNSYDAKGAASTALDDAKTYADGLAVNYDSAGSASAAQQNAYSYTDTKIAATNETVTANSEAIESLEEKVGDGTESITSDEITALFNE